MKIGIPKGLYYYYFFDKFKIFFENLGVEVITSCDTNKSIIENGSRLANDEMCLSLKIYLGHVDYIKDKCDYILIPRIDNYEKNEQNCCNFLQLYDLVNTIFYTKILTFNIDYKNDEYKGLYKIGKQLGFKNKEIKKALRKTILEGNKLKRRLILENNNKLNSNKKKVLIVSHSYNMYDSYIGKNIISYLEKSNCEVIYCDRFEKEVTSNLSKYLSRELYFKYSKENIGSIVLCNEFIDGIVFITSFPCGIDSLVTELVMRKISKPYLNLIIDDIDSQTGIETRLESFVDIIEQG